MVKDGFLQNDVCIGIPNEGGGGRFTSSLPGFQAFLFVLGFPHVYLIASTPRNFLGMPLNVC
jgi:hypothetical protein